MRLRRDGCVERGRSAIACAGGMVYGVLVECRMERDTGIGWRMQNSYNSAVVRVVQMAVSGQ